MKIRLFSIILFTLLAGGGRDVMSVPRLAVFEPDNQPVEKIIGIMVEFQEENPDDPLTSGTGKFLTADDDSSWVDRCDGFIADPPPHNRSYFMSQIEALHSYYFSVSNGAVDFEWEVIDEVYELSGTMRDYAEADTSLGRLFSEAVILAADDLAPQYTDNTLIVVFHAGISQDFAVPFLDPTPFDLKSAFVDEQIMASADWPVVNGYILQRGIILPETQNHLFFDVIEDIFYGETDYCDYQVGMTGTFAFLTGYALGLPPLFNTETGKAGVGIFGLMDYGSNNGRGVIPAPPTAWTRIIMGWESPRTLVDAGPQYIPARHIAEKDSSIQQIMIADNSEYFLIENRNNWVMDGKSIDRLRVENPISQFRYGRWFDVVTEMMLDDQISIDPATGVITGFDNYDYGLPGSGLLIWHISFAFPPYEGINNDRLHRAVHLEEADGAVDLGFESYAVFQSDDPTTGKIWDMWYAGNDGYFNANPDEEGTGDFLRFGMDTYPDTRSLTGGDTFIDISMISSAGDTMSYELNWYFPFETVQISDELIQVIGGSYSESDQTGFLYYYRDRDSKIFRVNSATSDSIVFQGSNKPPYILSQSSCDPDTVIIDMTESHLLYLDENCEIRERPQSAMGYLETPAELISTETTRVLGDIDGDGLDELIYLDNNLSGNLRVENANGTLVNGFPVQGDFYPNILVANILGDSSPEIILREDGNTVIISSSGERLFEMASPISGGFIFLIPFWNDTSIALINGNRAYLFPLDLEHSYWMFPFGRPSNESLVTGIHYLQNLDVSGIDGNRTYNYPNPVTEGLTRFRYYTGNTSRVEIKIYDSSGYLVETLVDADPVPGEYNETVWRPQGISPGLYLAEVRADGGKSKLVRVVYLK